MYTHMEHARFLQVSEADQDVAGGDNPLDTELGVGVQFEEEEEEDGDDEVDVVADDEEDEEEEEGGCDVCGTCATSLCRWLCISVCVWWKEDGGDEVGVVAGDEGKDEG